MKRDNRDSDRIVIGKRAVLELLRAAPQRVECLLYAGRSALPEGEFGEIAAAHRLKVTRMLPAELTERVGSDSHQSLAVILRGRSFFTVQDILDEAQTCERMLVLMLDGIQDPHNFGAVLRAAECFGANAVIWSKNRGSGLTPVVTKSSAGASELLRLVPVSNVADTLRKLKAGGFWGVATALTEGAVSLPEFVRPQKIALMLGTEGKGLSDLLIREADFVVKIPMLGKIQSLNVSQAGSVMLYALQAAGMA